LDGERPTEFVSSSVNSRIPLLSLMISFAIRLHENEFQAGMGFI
jgi:hypothetical protein